MAGPPWLNPKTQQGVVPRDGDLWISVPVKSGTNWMMNVVHQLLTGGDADFDSIYSVVAWPEFTERRPDRIGAFRTWSERRARPRRSARRPSGR